MKIVVLDGEALNPGDLAWDGLAEQGELTVHPRTRSDEVLPRAAGAEVLLTNKTRLTRHHLENLHDLRYIGVLATGYDVVDTGAARERGIAVTNVPAYGTASVAQLTFALLLELTNRVGHHAEAVGAGRWSAAADFCFWDFPQLELRGKTLGILGLGRIGTAVGTIGAAFGMEVIATSRAVPEPPPAWAEMVRLEDLFSASDVLTLHCPLTADTQQIVDAGRLAAMKSTAFLINTARGGLVEEAALAAALNEGRLAGAGLDVLCVEPPPDTNPLLQARNCIVTPHLAWATREARTRLLAEAVANLKEFLGGKPRNRVA